LKNSPFFFLFSSVDSAISLFFLPFSLVGVLRRRPSFSFAIRGHRRPPPLKSALLSGRTFSENTFFFFVACQTAAIFFFFSEARFFFLLFIRGGVPLEIFVFPFLYFVWCQGVFQLPRAAVLFPPFWSWQLLLPLFLFKFLDITAAKAFAGSPLIFSWSFPPVGGGVRSSFSFAVSGAAPCTPRPSPASLLSSYAGPVSSSW